MAMRYDEEVESVYQHEISSKKNQMYQYKNATKGRRLGKGNVRFPSDYMTRAEKKKHLGAGEVMTTNLYKDILTIAEFDALENHEKRNRMQYWRSEHKIKDIMKGMGITNKKFYDILEQLDLPVAKRSEFKKRTGTTSKKEPAKASAPAKTETKVNTPEVVKNDPQGQLDQPQVQQIIVNGLNLILQGTYSAEQIQKQLKKFSVLLEDEPDDFYLEFRLMQKQPKK